MDAGNVISNKIIITSVAYRNEIGGITNGRK